MENKAYPQKSIQDDKFLNALAEAFRLQEAILNSAPFAIISTTPDGLINSFNKGAENLLGYSCEEMIGRSNPLVFYDIDEIFAAAAQLNGGEVTEPVFEIFTKKIQEEGSAFRTEWTMIRKNGTLFPAQVTINALQDEDGTLIGFVTIAQDNSSLKLTQEKVTIAQEQLEKVAEENLRVFNNPVNLNAIAGFDGYFRRLSPSWSNVLGWSIEELLNKPFIEFVHPEDVEATKKAAKFIAEGNHLLTFENRYRCKDGSYKWMLWGSASDIRNQLIYASAIDITERKHSEIDLVQSKKNLESAALKLQEQNKQLDEFAHIISHNFRSPLGNIQALVNLLDEDSSLTDYKLIFDKLKNVAKNLTETMNDLMDTLKVRENTNVERTELRFKDVLDKVVQSLEGQLINAQASVTFDFNSASTISYPKAYLESIFLNLLSNCVKYRSDARILKIHFKTNYHNSQIELRVSDNGLGIDMKKYGDKLFGLHKTFHMHEEARGVGLFLIKTQIQSLGGTIHAESEVDKGTTFVIRF